MKKNIYQFLVIFLLFLAIFIIFYTFTKTNYKSSSDCDCDCDCNSNKEGFSLLQARQHMTQIARGGKSLTAINTALKNKLKNTKNKFTGFKNYIDVNYYYDKINNLLS
jgi:hypothetical protein